MNIPTKTASTASQRPSQASFRWRAQLNAQPASRTSHGSRIHTTHTGNQLDLVIEGETGAVVEARLAKARERYAATIKATGMKID